MLGNAQRPTPDDADLEELALSPCPGADSNEEPKRVLNDQLIISGR